VAPRLPPRQRLATLATEGGREFRRLGYRGTKTAEVAARAGMSSGSLFTYVESKEALFHLVFLHGFGYLSESAPELPLATPGPGETLAVIEHNLRKVPIPKMRAALQQSPPRDAAAELRGIVEERYDMLAQLWPVLAVIERCAAEMPDLEAFYFQRTRTAYLARLAEYLEKRAATGHFRPMHDAAIAARLITESIAWFAWKRREGRDVHTYDDAAVRETLVQFVCSAVVAA
jgi:AcrR family transcriptional regulator